MRDEDACLGTADWQCEVQRSQPVELARARGSRLGARHTHPSYVFHFKITGPFILLLIHTNALLRASSSDSAHSECTSCRSIRAYASNFQPDSSRAARSWNPDALTHALIPVFMSSSGTSSYGKAPTRSGLDLITPRRFCRGAYRDSGRSATNESKSRRTDSRSPV